MRTIYYLGAFSASLALLAGCSALTSTTNTTADALHTVSHGLSASSRSSTDSTDSDPQSAQAARTRAYVNSQMSQLQREAANGGGEHVSALAALMNSPRPDQLGPWMQAHYKSLFAQRRTASQFVQFIRTRRS